MSDQDAPRISRYLLGQLPPEEMDRIEARLLSEQEHFELAEAVEDEVIDRYARGELAPEERRRFERRLLPSPRIRERVALARALAAQGARRAAAAGPDDRGAVPSVVPVAPLLRPAAARLAWAATLAAALVGGWLTFQVLRLGEQVDQAEQARLAAVAESEQAAAGTHELEAASERDRRVQAEAARLESELGAARERIAELESAGIPETPAGPARGERRIRRPGDYGQEAATASLFLGLATRSDAAPAVLRLEGAALAELQLDLGGQRPSEPVAATVTRGGQPVWREEGVAVEALDGESMAVLTLPQESLQAGRYRVELTAGSPPHLLGSYELSVERRAFGR